MAIDVAENSILKYTIFGALDNQLTENVFHLRNKAASNLEHLEDFLNNNLLGKFYEALSFEFTCTGVSLQSLSPVHTDPYEEAKAFGGGDVLESLPVANAIVVSMKTGLGGRHNRGRKYLAGVVSQGVDNSRLSEEYRTNLQTDWNQMAAIFNGGGTGELEWGIYHKTVDGGTTTHHLTVCNSVIVRPILGTMRSRLPGHGR